MIDGEQHAVPGAPGDEGPAGAVPQPADGHGGDQVDGGARRARAAAAERHIDEIAQETRQRDMPAPPEIDDAGGAERRGEVDRQAQVEQQAKPDRHFGIAGEVEIELPRIGERAAPGGGRGDGFAARRGIEHRRDEFAERIGDQHFLGESEQEDGQAERDVVPVDAVARAIRDLRPELGPAHDRAGDQVREERDEHRVLVEAPDLAAPPDVDQERDLHERRERQRERHLGRSGRHAGHDREQEVRRI